MRLYLIKRRSDGFFLRAIEAHYSVHSGQDKTAWSETPAYMLRTADGVAMNLRKLCSDPYLVRLKFGNEMAWKNFDPEKLKLYEVVCMDVDIISMKATPAEDFVQVDKVASIPLTRTERNAA